MNRILAISSAIAVSMLVACRVDAPNDSGSAISQPAEKQVWYPTPGEPKAPEDPPPPSEKVPAPSKVAPRAEGDPGAPTVFVYNDLADDTAAAICVYRASKVGSYTLDVTPGKTSEFGPGDAISISRDLTEDFYGPGFFVTGFVLSLRSPPKKTDDLGGHGPTRSDFASTIGVYLTSAASNPDAFATGKTEDVTIWYGSSSRVCSADGYADESDEGEYGRSETGRITVTKRTATSVQGKLEIADSVVGIQRLVFDAPFADADFATDPLCCLK